MNTKDKKPATELDVRKAEIRADLLKWLIGTVALTLVTTIGNWTFQYYSLRAEGEKTNRELRIKEKEMQLQYLEKFTQIAIEQDVAKRIRLAHYISSTIDDKEYGPLAKKWKDYYLALMTACQDRLDSIVREGKIELRLGVMKDPSCTIGGLESVRVAPPIIQEASLSDPGASGGGKLGELIARAESGRAGYNSFNRGISGDSGGSTLDFSALTIEEVMARQALPRDDPNRLFVVGRYSLIPGALKAAIVALKLDPKSKFTPATQEKIFRNYLVGSKRPSIKNFITGTNEEIGAAQNALALEFASVARPDTGLSYFGGLGGARALISAQQTAQALADERAAYRQSIDAGLSPEAAWNALSPGIAEQPIAQAPRQ